MELRSALSIQGEATPLLDTVRESPLLLIIVMMHLLQPCLTSVVEGDGLVYIPGVTLRHRRGQMLSYQFIANSKQVRNAGKMGKLAAVKRGILITTMDLAASCSSRAAGWSAMSHWSAWLQFARGVLRLNSSGFYALHMLTCCFVCQQQQQVMRLPRGRLSDVHPDSVAVIPIQMPPTGQHALPWELGRQ